MDAVALRGRRQGAAAPPAPPARDCVPWNPDSMPSHDERQTHMLVGRWEPAVHDRALGSFDVRWPCAGGGKGRPRPLHPRPGRCPWHPDLMHGPAERLAHMLMGRRELATDDRGLISMQECLQINTNGIKRSSAWHNGGMRRWIVHAASIICRGSGGQPAHPAGGAGGGARPHPCIYVERHVQHCTTTTAAPRSVAGGAGGRARPHPCIYVERHVQHCTTTTAAPRSVAGSVGGSARPHPRRNGATAKAMLAIRAAMWQLRQAWEASGAACLNNDHMFI